MYKDFAAKYPDSPKSYTALCNAAYSYYRSDLREPSDPNKARYFHQQIIDKDPNLLIMESIFSKGNLACVYPTADERFEGRLSFYRWLKSIKPEDYQHTVDFMKKDYNYRNKNDDYLKEQIQSLINATIDTEERNILGDARSSENPFNHFEFLINEFPDSNLS
jgi:hypothetical protein